MTVVLSQKDGSDEQVKQIILSILERLELWHSDNHFISKSLLKIKWLATVHLLSIHKRKEMINVSHWDTEINVMEIYKTTHTPSPHLLRVLRSEKS